MKRFYRTEAQKVVRCTFLQWLVSLLTGQHRVAETLLPEGRVSTIFRGFWIEVPVFETAYIRHEGSADIDITYSWQEAERTHYRTCNQLHLTQPRRA